MMYLVKSLTFGQLLIIELVLLFVIGLDFYKNDTAKKEHAPIIGLAPLLCVSTLIWKYSLDHPELNKLHLFAESFLYLSIAILFGTLIVISMIKIKKNNQETKRSLLIKLLVMLFVIISLYLIMMFVIPKL